MLLSSVKPRCIPSFVQPKHNLPGWMETSGGQGSYLLPPSLDAQGLFVFLAQSLMEAPITSAPLTTIDPVPGTSLKLSRELLSE